MYTIYKDNTPNNLALCVLLKGTVNHTELMKPYYPVLNTEKGKPMHHMTCSNSMKTLL